MRAKTLKLRGPKEQDQANAARFWSKIHRSTNIECWEWTAYRTPDGYGRIKVSGRMLLAHRVAWMFEFGPIPEGLCVCHRCDNPKCCNPHRLFLGTQLDNMRDATRKGRTLPNRRRGENHPWHLRPELIPRGDRAGARKHPERVVRGERCHSAKLTEPDVVLIRKLASSGVPISDLAHQFGIAKVNVRKVVQGRNWKHVPMAPEEPPCAS